MWTRIIHKKTKDGERAKYPKLSGHSCALRVNILPRMSPVTLSKKFCYTLMHTHF